METKWNLKHLYENDKAWEVDINILKECLIELTSKEQVAFENEVNFLKFLEYNFKTYELIEKLYLYPKRSLDICVTDEVKKEQFKVIANLYNEYLKITNAFENELLLNQSLVNKYLANPSLEHYTRYIYLILRNKEHLISRENEDFLARYNENYRNIRLEYQELINSLDFGEVTIDGEVVKITKQNYEDLMLNKNRDLRRQVYASYNKSYKKIEKEITKLYIKKIANDINNAQLCHFESVLANVLFTSELRPDVVNNLIHTCEKYIDIEHKFITLKKQILGIEDYQSYDMGLSICSIDKLSYEFSEALDIAKKSLSILGEDYVSLIDKMFNEGWVDIYPRDNKRTMSFTGISYSGVPYILLNYNNTLESLRTLVHEMGHGIHTWYSKITNKYEYFEFQLFTTEIVAKINEALLNNYLLRNVKSDEEKIYVLNYIISALSNSLFGQILLTEFEYSVINDLASGKSLTNEDLYQKYQELSKKYNGPDLETNEFTGYGWLKIPHFIMQSTYYVYQYSFCTAIALVISAKILSNDQEFITKYKEFLKLGNTLSIEDSLRFLGVDFNDTSCLDNAFKLLDNYVDEMQRLVLKNKK